LLRLMRPQILTIENFYKISDLIQSNSLPLDYWEFFWARFQSRFRQFKIHFFNLMRERQEFSVGHCNWLTPFQFVAMSKSNRSPMQIDHYAHS
jgi:hypothetical protein